MQRFQRHVLKDTRHILTSVQNTRDWACDIFTKFNYISSTRNDKKLVQPKCFSFNQLQVIYSFRYKGARHRRKPQPPLCLAQIANAMAMRGQSGSKVLELIGSTFKDIDSE